MKPFWIWRSHPTATHQIGLHSITPIAQSIGLQWPGGGWLWQFPLAVEIEDKRDGTHKRLPIPDPTRIAIWFMVGLALTLLFVTALGLWQNRRHTKQDRKLR
jgi:hypothetical protein